MTSSKQSKKKKNHNKSNFQLAERKNQNIRESKSKISIIIICNFVILMLLIILFIYNIFIINKNMKRINENVQKLNEQQMQLETIAPHYVFLGDSITEQYELTKYFNGYSVINSGISGDTTEVILKNMEERVYQYNPSTVFIMIGTNDINQNKSTEYVFNNIKKIVQEIQINLPNAKIIVESIIPSQEDWGDYDDNAKRREINKLLYNEYKDSSVTYVDLYSLLEDENSQKLSEEYSKDGLHINDSAYEIISKELKKYMTMKNR